MKKIRFSGIVPLVMMPLCATSCSLGLLTPRGREIDRIGVPSVPLPPVDKHPGGKKDIIVDKNVFEYNGIKFNLSEEDSFDKNEVFYASDVLENSAKFNIKNIIPKVKDYQIANFNDAVVPNISKFSRYVRSIGLDKKMKLNRSSDAVVNEEQFKKLFSILKDILSVEQNTTYDEIDKSDGDIAFKIFNNKYLNNFLIHYRNLHFEDYKKIDKALAGQIKSSTYWKDNIKYEDYHITSPLEKDKNLRVVLRKYGVYKTIPNLRWRFDREFSTSSSFEEGNEDILLSQLFYEQQDEYKIAHSDTPKDGEPGSKDNPVPDIDLSGLDWFYLSNTKSLMMQSVQYRLLVAYVEFMNAMLNKINDDKKELSVLLKDNYEAIVGYEKALLDYIKLDYILGLTFENKLIMFPSIQAQGQEADFRDTYRWALNQYENVVLPLKYKMSEDYFKLSEQDFNNAFDKNTKRMPYYQVIWKNIELVDRVKRPRFIERLYAEARMQEIIKNFEPFGWKYKK